VALFTADTHFVVYGAAAIGETYCLAHHVSVEGDERTIMIASIRYDDTFTKSDGTWLFSERRLYVDWTDTRPISP
jgi:SnoaL-like domain